MTLTKERLFWASFLTAIITLCIGFFRPIPEDPEYNTMTQWERFWVLKTHTTINKYDLVALGDSRTYRGLVPQEMDSILQGLKILNFGYSAGGLNKEMYHEGEIRLASNGKPKVIILGVTPRNLSEITKKNDFFFQEKHRNFAYKFFRMHAPWFVDFFKPITIDVLENVAGLTKPSVMYYQEFHNDGWAAAWTVPERPDLQLAGYRAQFQDPSNRASESLMNDLVDQVKKWTSQGIFVFACRFPTTQKMRELEDNFGGLDEINLSARITAAGGRWMNFPCSTYVSYDGSHLRKESAKKFSRDLALELKLHLDSAFQQF